VVVASLQKNLIPANEEGKETVVLLTGRNVAPALLSEVIGA